MIGFTLVNWGIGHASFADAFSEAGSSVFTLGFTSSHTEGSRVVDFVAAGTGLVLVALQIAYLPTLYSAYNRRETLVTLLESRAGAPAWGPELLIRHQLVGTVDNLASLFAEWERWAADVAESHTTYPSLLYLRSPRARNSWIVSLHRRDGRRGAGPGHRPRGRAHRGPDVHPDGVHLPARHRPGHPDPLRPRPRARRPHRAARGGVPDAYAPAGRPSDFPTSRPAEEAWAHFRGWRVNYESVAYAVAYRLDAPPAQWSGPRRRFRGESMESGPAHRPPAAERPAGSGTLPTPADARGPEPAAGPGAARPWAGTGRSAAGATGVPVLDHALLPLPAEDAYRRRAEHEVAGRRRGRPPATAPPGPAGGGRGPRRPRPRSPPGSGRSPGPPGWRPRGWSRRPGRPVAEEVPARSVLPDGRGRPALVVAVVPFDQVRVGLAVAQSGQLGGLAGPGTGG